MLQTKFVDHGEVQYKYKQAPNGKTTVTVLILGAPQGYLEIKDGEYLVNGQTKPLKDLKEAALAAVHFQQRHLAYDLDKINKMKGCIKRSVDPEAIPEIKVPSPTPKEKPIDKEANESPSGGDQVQEQPKAKTRKASRTKTQKKSEGDSTL